MMRQQLAITRELIDGHTLTLELQQTGQRPSKSDAITVLCTCGEVIGHSIFGQYRRALAVAERAHRLQCGWPDVAEWHGTPSGYVNHCCRCDPCTWAWASYRRGDDPVDASPVWLDDMLMASL